VFATHRRLTMYDSPRRRSAARDETGRRCSPVRLAIVRCADAVRFALAADSPLTKWERTVARRIAHPRRRDEWVAGRIAAKWLFLEDMDRTMSECWFTWPPPVTVVAPDHLAGISPASYRRVEVRRHVDGAPYLACDDVATDVTAVRVSIAHCGGWAVAALSLAGAVGVDLEDSGPHGRGFYESNLTDRERRWMIGAPEGSADRIGTLLWVLKEAVLKTGASAAHTIWEMSAMDIDVATPAAEIADTWPLDDAGGAPCLVTLPVRVALTRAPRSFTHAAYGAIGQLAVGVVAVTSFELDRAPAAP
jgi:4'-phosphopantetheinyl transferase EntD